MPTGLLLLSTFLALVSAVALRNHSSLTEGMGRWNIYLWLLLSRL